MKEAQGCAMGNQQVPLMLWFIYGACLILLAATTAHLQLTTLTDNVGFSSNSEYYYHSLHPVRTMLRTAVFFLGLIGALLCLWFLGKHGRGERSIALLLLAGVSALWVFAVVGLIGAAIVFVMMRNGGNAIEVVLVVMQLLPSLIALVAVVAALRRGNQQWLQGIAAALMLLHGAWWLFGGPQTFTISLIALVCGVAISLNMALTRSRGKEAAIARDA